jgi:Membrane protein involved in the export of O-antigen and teichoic acid
MINLSFGLFGQLFEPSDLKRYIDNFALLLADRFVRVVISLTVGVWVARYLGPSDFGVLSYALSLIAILSVLAKLGLHDVLVKGLVQGDQVEGELLGAALCLRLMSGFATVLIVFLVVYFHLDSLEFSDIIILLSLSAVFQAANVFEAFFQSKLLNKYVVYSWAITLLIGAFLRVWLILVEAPLIPFVIVHVFESIVIAVGLIGFYLKVKEQKIQWRIKCRTANKLLKSAWPLMISGLFVCVYMKVDQLMIFDMLDSASVGEYAAAVKLSEAWYFIPLILTSVVFPAILRLRNSNIIRYQLSLQLLYFVLLVIAVLVASVMTFLSDYLIEWLYGDEFSAAADVLKVHTWAAVFVFWGLQALSG